MHTTTIQTQDGRGPCCGRTQITYYPLDLDNGSKAERWTCAVPGGCGREFVPRARAERAERELGEYQAKACEDLAAAWSERDEARAERDDLDEKYTTACGDVAWRQAKVNDLTRALADADKHADDQAATVERAREVARLARGAEKKANDTAKRYQTERDAAVARESQWERLAQELSGGHDGLGDFREWCEQLKCDYDVECGVRSQREGEIAALRARLAKTEGAAEVLRQLLPDYKAAISMLDTEDEESAESRELLLAAQDALRALDEDSPVGVAATAEDGHEAPAQNRQPVEPPSDPATGTTRREPPETAIGGSTGAVIQAERWHRLTSDPAEPGDAGSNPAPTGSSGTPGPTGGAIPPAVACGLMHVRCANCTDYIDRENAHDCTRGKNACGECDQEPCACPDPQAPATRAELEELRREILTTLSDALERIHIPVPGSSGWAEVPLGLRELAEELRRRIERLETKE